MSVVQTTANTAVLTFASEEAAKAAAGKVVVKRQNTSTTTEMKSQSQTVDGNKVVVKLYADFEKNTNYEFTSDETKAVLAVGDLKVVDLAIYSNPSSFVLKDTQIVPNTSNMLRVYTYAKDEEGNAILLKEVSNDYDTKIRIADADATKGLVSGNKLTIYEDGKTVEVSAEYQGVSITKSFTATALASYKFVSIEEVSVKGNSVYYSWNWQKNDGTLSIPKNEEDYASVQPRLDLVIRDTLGADLITNNVINRAYTEIIDQVKWVTNDGRRLQLKYESKNPNVLMVSANDGTLYAVNEGNTEVVVTVEVQQGASEPTSYVLGVVPVTVTGKRKLTTVKAIANNFNGVLNDGDFTKYTMTWSVKDQYGEDYKGFAIDSAKFQQNYSGNNTYEWPTGTIDTNATSGWAVVTVDADNAYASDRAWTFELVLKDTDNGNAKTTYYAYVKVVDADNEVTATNYFEKTEARIDAVDLSVVAGAINDQNTIVSAGKGSYTLNYINYDGTPVIEDDVKIMVISYYKGLPYCVEDYAFVQKDGKVDGTVLIGTNTGTKFNYNLDGVTDSAKAAQYRNEINMSMRNRAFNNANLLSIYKGTKDLVKGQNAGITNDTLHATSGAVSAVDTKNYSTINSAYSTLRADVRQVATGADAVVFDTQDIIHSDKNNIAGAYTIELRVPVLNTASDDGSMTYLATETTVKFTLNVVDNSKGVSVVARANQEADCYSEYSVLCAILDSWTTPINWQGGNYTVYRRADGTIATIVEDAYGNKLAEVELPDNSKYLKRDYSASNGLTGIYVYKVKITVYGVGFTYSNDVAVNQYVKHIGY